MCECGGSGAVAALDETERCGAQRARGDAADRQFLLDGGEGYGVELGVLAGRGGGEEEAGDAAFGALAGGEAGVVLGVLGGGLDAGGLLAELGGAQLGLGGLVVGLGLLASSVGELGGGALRVLLAALRLGGGAGRFLAEACGAELGFGGLLLRLGGVAAGGGGFRRLQCVGLGAGLALRRCLLELRPGPGGLRLGLGLGGGGGRLGGGRAGAGGDLVLRLGDVGLVGQGGDVVPLRLIRAAGLRAVRRPLSGFRSVPRGAWAGGGQRSRFLVPRSGSGDFSMCRAAFWEGQRVRPRVLYVLCRMRSSPPSSSAGS
ncbi:hypothetical protein ABT248_31540 [Streptomyces sp. NPDC000971]|uniref:hypothetical protein n=1 Tax=Streptomyces sp. NPDC000971 TaxID=3156647 RepID=UPI00332D57CF